VGEVIVIGDVPFIWLNRRLVGARIGNGAHQVLKVEVVIGDVFSEGVKESGVGGRIGGADVVDRIDDASTEEIAPDAIGDSFGEKGIVSRDDPIGESVAAVFVGGNGHRLGGRDEQFGGNGATVLRVLHFVIGALIEDDLFADLVAGAQPNRGEEG
jgi:hypothetical protein